jgi:hypothetical protein
MKILLRILPSVALAACGSGPDSSATFNVQQLDGTTTTTRAMGPVVWTGVGEQITARLNTDDAKAADALTLPLRITRLGRYTVNQPVTVRSGGRAWVSRSEAPTQVTIDRLWFTGDKDHPWRHFGSFSLTEPRPVDHALEVNAVDVEFAIQGPACQLANEGEARCAQAWNLGAGTVNLSISPIENTCPAYVVETWIDSEDVVVTPFQIDAGGFKRVNCIDMGGSERLCGSHEDGMEVGSCEWNATISLDTPSTLRIEGVARCGETEDYQSCSGRFRLRAD